MLHAKQRQRQKRKIGRKRLGGVSEDDVPIRRQRLGGVSLDDVAAQSINVEHDSAPAALLSYRGIETSEAQTFLGLGPPSEVHIDFCDGPTMVEPQLRVVPATVISSVEGLLGPTTDLGEVIPETQAFRGPEAIPVKSEGQTAASVTVVYATVEHQPLTSEQS